MTPASEWIFSRASVLLLGLILYLILMLAVIGLCKAASKESPYIEDVDNASNVERENN